MELKSYGAFAQALSAQFTRINPKDRDIILKKIYSFAVEKQEHENHKCDQTQTQMFRKRRLEFNRIRARVKNAIKELTLAHSVHPTLSKLIVGIPSLIEELREVYRKLETAEHSAAAFVHPEQRTLAERTLAPKAKMSLSLSYPKMKGAAIDYKFIADLDSFLDTLASAHGLIFSSPERNKTISKVFEAAFDVNYAASHVKVTRERLKERTRVSTTFSPAQNK
jgi:hypothetical protein